METGGRTRA